MNGNTGEDRYQDALSSIPRPGCGCHTFLLTVANYGVLAELSADQIFQDIRQSIPTGSRQISDREISDAIDKAMGDRIGGKYIPQPRPKPVVLNGKTVIQNIIDQGSINVENDLRELSPIRLRSRRNDPALLLQTLYVPTDLIWIGDRNEAGVIGETIRTSSDWICHLHSSRKKPPHIIINPLNGTPTKKKSGEGTTLRGDGNVASYRYCLVEFDNLSREDQIRFWSAVKLPIVALIDSGGKSIHAWLDVSRLATVSTSEQWTIEIKNNLYDRLLKPLGVDGACCNPARLSRLPGHFRLGKNNYQRLLWLSSEGRTIC